MEKYKMERNEKSNIIKPRPKLGRNDLCYCGSGKKYKNCCMKKDQEKERIENLLAQYETVSDKYFTAKEYIKLSGYPITKFDFFLLEILNMTGSILYKYNKTSNDKTEEIIKNLYRYSKDFYKECLNCKNNCINNSLKNADFKSLTDDGFDMNELPENLQEPTRMNLFYIEFANGLATALMDQLSKEIGNETANEISETLYWTIIDYVSDNCYDQCNNECLLEHDKNAYCKFCTFGSKKLPCPKEGLISYETIKASYEDIE